jgi:hypothetical protein
MKPSPAVIVFSSRRPLRLAKIWAFYAGIGFAFAHVE